MKEKNDGLALVVGGLFILALVFATYNYFNKGDDSKESLEQKIEEMRKEQGSMELGTTELNNEEVKGEEATETIKGEVNGNGASTMVSTVWVANDYKQGDITGSTYTVKSGDTLWEIAEAVYGNGADWVRLLDANNSSIGFLSNGQQALIMPGQVLNIAM